MRLGYDDRFHLPVPRPYHLFPQLVGVDAEYDAVPNLESGVRPKMVLHHRNYPTTLWYVLFIFWIHRQHRPRVPAGFHSMNTGGVRDDDGPGVGCGRWYVEQYYTTPW